MSSSYFAFVILTLLLLAFVGYGTYRATQLLPNWPIDENPLLAPSETVVRLVLIVVCIALGLLSGQSWATLGWQMPQPLAQIGWGVLWGIVIAGIYIITTRWVVAKSGRRYYTPNVVRVIVPRSRQQLWAIALVMVTVVLLEELLFRSLLLGGFSPLLPVWLLLAASGVLFGLMHSPQGWWGMVAIALGGILLGTMFVMQKSLLMPSVAHYVANMIQIVYAYRVGLSELTDQAAD